MCRVIFWLFAALYAAALAVFVVGSFGLFGTEQAILSAVFLIPLGVPWIFVVDWFPDPLPFWLGLLSPAVNLLIVGLVCRYKKRTANPDS